MLDRTAETGAGQSEHRPAGVDAEITGGSKVIVEPEVLGEIELDDEEAIVDGRLVMVDGGSAEDAPLASK